MTAGHIKGVIAGQWQGEAQPKASRAHLKEKLPVAAGKSPNTAAEKSPNTAAGNSPNTQRPGTYPFSSTK